MPVKLDLDLDGYAFVEGSPIGATVRAVADRDATVHAGDVELVRSVTYRFREGNAYAGFYTVPARERQVVVRGAFLGAGVLPAGQPYAGVVVLPVPAHGPGSVASELVEVDWTVHARLRAAGIRDVEVAQRVLVLSAAGGCAGAAGTPPVVHEHGLAALGFDSLSSRRLVPGQALSGVLTVQPRRAGTARAVRVEVVLREVVEHGPWLGDHHGRQPAAGSKHAETVVASQPVAGPVPLEPARPLRLPFTLAVPPRLAGPSMTTPAFRLTWVLRAVVDRHLHPDPCVEVELHGTTG